MYFLTVLSSQVATDFITFGLNALPSILQSH